MAFFTIDDFSGSCECLMFAKVFSEFGKYVIEEEPVFVVGNLESSGDTVKMHVNKLLPLELARKQLSQSIKLIVNKDEITPQKLAKLKPVLKEYKGKLPVYIHLTSNGNKGSLYSLSDLRVELSDSLFNKVSELLGEESILLSVK